MDTAETLALEVGAVAACGAMGVSRATLYRRRRPTAPNCETRPQRPQPRALDRCERQAVLAALHSSRFVDKAPAAVYATLLDEGVYHCSTRTMYRILHDHREVRERRDQLRHPNYKKPELLATGPNQVWSWDITKLLGPAKWTYYYLYVILDEVAQRSPAYGCVGRGEIAQPAAGVERQPLFRKPVQDDEIPAGVSPSVRLTRGRARLLQIFFVSRIQL